MNDVNDGALNALSVDVEEHFQVSGFADVVSRETWAGRPSRVADSTSRLLDLFDEAGVSATFFVLGWIGERHAALLREIVARGHEIASHGYDHELIYRQSPQRFREESARTKRLLEDASGTEVAGHRAASFSITRASLWATDVLAECGFRYDSSLFPVVHDRYGVPGAPRGIYRLRTPGGAALIEVPPSTVRIGRLVIPIAGGGYLRLYPFWVTRWAIRRLNRDEGMPAVIYVHPWEVDPGQPRIRAGWKSRFRHYQGLGTTLPKLRALLRRFRFGTMREVVEAASNLPERRIA